MLSKSSHSALAEAENHRPAEPDTLWRLAHIVLANCETERGAHWSGWSSGCIRAPLGDLQPSTASFLCGPEIRLGQGFSHKGLDSPMPPSGLGDTVAQNVY